MRCDLNTISDLNDKKLIKPLAFAVAVKARHTNSRIYNFTKSKIYKSLGISRHTYLVYCNALIENGLAFISGNTFEIKSLYKFKTKAERTADIKNVGKVFNPTYRYRRYYYWKKDIEYISSDLFVNLFKEEYRKQQNIVRLKSSANNTQNPTASVEASKKAISDRSKLWKLGYEVDETNKVFEICDEINFSVKTICEKLGLSKHGWYKLIKHMKTKGIINVLNRNVPIGKYRDGIMRDPSKNYFISKGGWVYQCSSNAYHMPSMHILYK